MSNWHLVFVYAAGHVISADRPEAFTEVVVDFLERHEAFVILGPGGDPPVAHGRVARRLSSSSPVEYSSPFE